MLRSGLDIFRSSVAGRFSLMFFALLIPLAVVGLMIGRGVTSNAQELLDALRVKELASRSLALVLTQDDVTKEILLNVERVSEAHRKIAAYDENHEALAEIERLTSSPELLQLVRQMQRLDDQELRPADSRVLEVLVDLGPEAAQALYFEDYEPLRERYQQLALRLNQKAQDVAREEEVLLAEKNRRSVINVVVALLVGVLSVAVIMLLITRDVRGRLRRVADVLEAVARRDLTRDPEVDASDEIGRIALALHQAISEMRSALRQATDAANQVETESARISRATEAVATATAAQGDETGKAVEAMERVTDQVWGIAESARGLRSAVTESSRTAAHVEELGEQFHTSAKSLTQRIEETSRALDAMTAGVNQVSQSTAVLAQASTETTHRMGAMARAMEEVDGVATESARLCQAMVERGEDGLAKVQATIEGIQSVRDGVRAAESAVGGLGERAEEIGAVVDVIKSVASETNLLALNASIIAARTSENGRPFAVVAERIRSLAERVTTHTKEIEALIRSVQDESGHAVETMKEGSERVIGLAAISAEAGGVVEEMTRSSRTSAQRLAEVADAVREQTRVSREVVEFMRRTDAEVGEIRSAADAQARGNELVRRAAAEMHEVATQICARAVDQIGGISEIGKCFGGIRDAAATVEDALQQQSRCTQELSEALERVGNRSKENTKSAELTATASDELRELAEALRRHVLRFTL